METSGLSAFAIMEQGQMDSLKPETELPDIDHDRLKPGEEFWLRMNCPACGHPVRGRKEQDFSCPYCFLLFRYQKK